MGETVEDRLRSLEIRQATTEERIDNIGQGVKEIKATLSKLNWLVLGAVVIQLLNMAFTK
jgi:uncharacterized coiled-coil protein SlyX